MRWRTRINLTICNHTLIESDNSQKFNINCAIKTDYYSLGKCHEGEKEVNKLVVNLPIFLNFLHGFNFFINY